MIRLFIAWGAFLTVALVYADARGRSVHELLPGSSWSRWSTPHYRGGGGTYIHYHK